MYTYSMFRYVWLVFRGLIFHFSLFDCLSIFCLVDRILYMGCSVVCMVRSGGYSVLLLDSLFLFSFLLAFGGVGELSVNKHG